MTPPLNGQQKWGMFTARGNKAVSDLVRRAVNKEDALQRLEFLAKDKRFEEATDTSVREHVAIHFDHKYCKVWDTERELRIKLRRSCKLPIGGEAFYHEIIRTGHCAATLSKDGERLDVTIFVPVIEKELFRNATTYDFTHAGRRTTKRGKCEKCDSETNWLVISSGRPAYWCGCD